METRAPASPKLYEQTLQLHNSNGHFEKADVYTSPKSFTNYSPGYSDRAVVVGSDVLQRISFRGSGRAPTAASSHLTSRERGQSYAVMFPCKVRWISRKSLWPGLQVLEVHV